MEEIFVNLPRLSHLSLAHNRLHSLRNGIIKNTPKLQSLDLSHNEFVTFNLDVIEDSNNLQHLDLSRNKLTKLVFTQAKAKKEDLKI